MSVSAKQQHLVERLSLIEDPQERLAALMSRAKKWPSPTPAELTDETRVPGCQSRVWLVPSMRDGTCHLAMECESPMVKGLVALMCEIFEGGTPHDVATTEPHIFETLGFTRMLTPTRLNGLSAVRSQIREFATRHIAG